MVINKFRWKSEILPAINLQAKKLHNEGMFGNDVDYFYEVVRSGVRGEGRFTSIGRSGWESASMVEFR